MDELRNLHTKIDNYQKILANTVSYRQVWKTELKESIKQRLGVILDCCGLKAEIIEKDEVDNLEAVILSLGRERSGIAEIIAEDTRRPLIKTNGALIYQQLFNGKIQVMIVFPAIEGYGDQLPPKMIGIYRPEELKEPFIIRHMEEFFKEIIAWEDFDDDKPAQNQRIGFNMNYDLADIQDN